MKFEDFAIRVNLSIEKASLLISCDANTMTEQEYEHLVKDLETWEAEVKQLLTESFAKKENSFFYEFISVRGDYANYIKGSTPQLSERIKGTISTIIAKIDYLKFNLKIISVCDHIAQKEGYSQGIRSKYTVRQKQELLLQKLYDLNDGTYYPLEMLLTGNGIVLRHACEIREFAEYLEEYDYIVCLGGLGADVSARITSTGSLYVEDSLTAYTETYEDIPAEKKEIDSRIDEIIAQFEKLGAGQEILFEELQDLKNLYGKLSKKNWGEMLKGKIVDLALGKLLDFDTLKFIYEKITGHELKSLGL